jgi:uncharacterized sulfatase
MKGYGLGMQQPNFVFIMTDTQATNVVGAYGHPELDTPNIDNLAERGIKFDRAYTTCPLCTPARAGIFSGIYPHTAGAWTNNLPLGDNIKTMGQRFQDNGYHTAYIGKWHLDGHDYFGAGLCPPGWDPAYWYDGKCYLSELSEDEIHLWREGLSSVEALRTHDVQAEFTWAHRISDRAIDFLRNDCDEPFLMVVSYDEPHHPFTCPPEYAEKFQGYEYPVGPGAYDTLENKPAHHREWAESAAVQMENGRVIDPLYFGCNSFVDAEIGRVIDAVHRHAGDGSGDQLGRLKNGDQHSRLKNTFIIFTSDHGDMLGAHRITGKGPAMYEEIAHIPLIVEGPAGLGAGTANPTLVSHIDLLPTMLELAGLEVPPIMQGQSLVPVLEGKEDLDKSVVVEFERYEIEHDSWGGFQPVRCMLSRNFKLVINLLHTDELYDLEADPAEIHNLIDHPGYVEVRNRMHDQLLTWMYEQRDPFRGPVWERRPWRETRRLRWRGSFRPRPADGYAPEVRDYDTGLPMMGVKAKPGEKAEEER